jgi:glucose/arabinose dehydrogenase
MKPWRLRSSLVAVCAAWVIVSVNAAVKAPGRTAGPDASAAAPQAAGARSGGGPSPGAVLWMDQCAGCHGTGVTAGRAPNLFDDAWLNRVDDTRMTDTIKNGLPNAEMPAFGTSLNDRQIFQLIQHIRTQTATARPRPDFVSNPDGVVVRSPKQTFRIELVATGLMTPWALAFLPDGRMLVTERDGRLRIVDHGTLSEPVKGTPTAHVQQDGGYLDVEVHPDYARNRWIYLAYSEDEPGYVPPPPNATPADGPAGRGGPLRVPSMTAIVRGRINDRNEWTDQMLIFRAPTELYSTSGAHYGCRLIFDRQDHLFFTLGERGNQANAQDLKTPLGKIHRVNDDGSVPSDNPFINTPGAVPTIWSYGHRNPEGLAWDPVTGSLWESEHGPNTADEINVIEKGHNYGWAVASKSGQAGLALSVPGMDDPTVYFTPTFAPAGISFYTGSRYPAWNNTSLFVGGLLGQALRRLEIKGHTVVSQEVLFNQFGRVRDVVQAPDGYFYVALQDPTGVPDPAGGNIPLSASTPGRVVRLIPVP